MKNIYLKKEKEIRILSFLFFLGDYQKAINYIERALVIIKKEFSDKHYKYGMFLNSLGLAYAMINDYKMAYDHSKQALQILIDCLGQDHPEICDVNFNLGDYCMKLVDKIDSALGTTDITKNQNEKRLKLQEAKRYYTEAQRIAQARFGPEHTKVKQLLSLLFIVDNYSILR
jgi:tetratricopeptide (TPR) repeat protein